VCVCVCVCVCVYKELCLRVQMYSVCVCVCVLHVQMSSVACVFACVYTLLQRAPSPWQDVHCVCVHLRMFSMRRCVYSVTMSPSQHEDVQCTSACMIPVYWFLQLSAFVTRGSATIVDTVYHPTVRRAKTSSPLISLFSPGRHNIFSGFPMFSSTAPDPILSTPLTKD
jgi:hypothetical protein